MRTAVFSGATWNRRAKRGSSSMEIPEERELIRKAQARDEHAFKVLMDTHKDRVRNRVAVKLNGCSREDIEDACSVAFVKAWTALPNFKPGRPGGFEKWLTVIATHAAYEILQKNGKRHLPFDDISHDFLNRSISTLVEATELSPTHRLVELAFKKLRYDCRFLILSSFVYGVAPIEIARFARQTMEPFGRHAKMASEIRGWLTSLIGPVEDQCTERRNTCFELLKKLVRELESKSRKQAQMDGSTLSTED
ncbi:MAG: RNA polymerase sigma factor [Verrucomicrobiales bacterium]|nr:RNA polymerase sigma factor [Verrucomicrobiales bacterium]